VNDEKIIEKAISLEEIKTKAEGILVEIPDWEPKKMIKVRLRSIDVTPILMETGVFPDELSVEVATMFEGADAVKKTSSPKKDDVKVKDDVKLKMEKFIPVLNSIAELALSEPTYEEIQKVYPLTFQQKLAIFTYIMGGIEKLKPFRT
jgi:hypothetical protein